jgi:hypothetical protein
MGCRADNAAIQLSPISDDAINGRAIRIFMGCSRVSDHDTDDDTRRRIRRFFAE